MKSKRIMFVFGRIYTKRIASWLEKTKVTGNGFSSSLDQLVRISSRCRQNKWLQIQTSMDKLNLKTKSEGQSLLSTDSLPSKPSVHPHPTAIVFILMNHSKQILKYCQLELVIGRGVPSINTKAGAGVWVWERQRFQLISTPKYRQVRTSAQQVSTDRVS